MSGNLVMSLGDVTDRNAVWWHDGSHQVIRLHGTSTGSVSLTATGVALDASGNPLPPQPPPPPPPWHESMRYFRMSQVTDDFFDAFRNVYLALESVLSHIAPVRLRANGRPAEGEGVWVKRALGMVAHQVDLRQFLANPGAAVSDGVDEVYQELYVDVRTAVFHAKQGRPVLLPQDLTGRHSVSDAKYRYTRLYLELAEKTFGTRFVSGGISAAGARLMGEALAGSSSIGVTSDDTSIEDEAERQILSPMGHEVCFVPATRATDLDEPFVTFYRGLIPRSSLAAVTSICRFAQVRSTDLQVLQIEKLPGQMSIKDFDVVEVVLGVRIASGNAPKSRYAT